MSRKFKRVFIALLALIAFLVVADIIIMLKRAPPRLAPKLDKDTEVQRRRLELSPKYVNRKKGVTSPGAGMAKVIDATNKRSTANRQQPQRKTVSRANLAKNAQKSKSKKAKQAPIGDRKRPPRLRKKKNRKRRKGRKPKHAASKRQKLHKTSKKTREKARPRAGKLKSNDASKINLKSRKTKHISGGKRGKTAKYKQAKQAPIEDRKGPPRLRKKKQRKGTKPKPAASKRQKQHKTSKKTREKARPRTGKLKPSEERKMNLKSRKTRHISGGKQGEKTATIRKIKPLYSELVINEHPFHFVDKSSACSKHAPNGEVFLLVLVACRPRELRDRQWIRDTWGAVRAYRGRRVLTRFLVGRTGMQRHMTNVAEESALYGDMVQVDFADNYRNMTHKVLMGLKWAAQMCPNATYVMNLDSDMFVNVFQLVDRLQSAPRRNFAEGNLKGVTRPYRGRSKGPAKWHTPVEMYPESTYPPYLNGPAYVMSGDLPGQIFNASAHVRYLPWDDVYIGLVMKKLGIKPIRGEHYEDYPLMKDWNDDNRFMRMILNTKALYVGHGKSLSFLLRDLWPIFLQHYKNYVYAPPLKTKLGLNIFTKLRHH